MDMQVKYISGSKQRGGALVETLVLGTVLILLMACIPAVGALVDLKQTTIQASRYVAWEKSVYAPEVRVSDKVDVRFFRDPSASIKSMDSERAGVNLLWGSPGSVVNADIHKLRVNLVDAGSSASIEHVNGSPSLKRANIHQGWIYPNEGKVFGGLGRGLSKHAWKEGDPYTNGLMQSRVEVKVENNSLLSAPGTQCSQGGAGCVHESTAILVDGWSAGRPDTIRDRVHGFVPSHRLEKVGKVISKIKVIPLLGDMKNLKRALGCTKLGVKPAKKLNGLPSYKPQNGDDC